MLFCSLHRYLSRILLVALSVAKRLAMRHVADSFRTLIRGILFFSLTAAGAFAADHQVCVDYANLAVAVYKETLQLGCAEKNPVPGRLSDNFKGHYDWCRGVRNSTLDNENVEREKLINTCRRCQSYAGGAVASAKEYERLRCGSPSNRWGTDFVGHRNWCLGVRKSTQEGEDNARDQELKACRAQLSAGSAPHGTAPSAPGTVPPTRQCNIQGHYEVYQCRNLDSTPSDYFTRSTLSTCGTTEKEALAAAQASLNTCLSDDPGCCQYRVQYTTGACNCSLPPDIGSRLAARLPTASSGPGNWSAFAASGNGRWGFAVHQSSFKSASEQALQGCGGSAAGCKVFGSSTDRCVSFAESRQSGYWYAAGSGADDGTARSNAVRHCQSGTAPRESCRAVNAWCR
jgi:Domain of unknown function (DUF4189)